MSGSGYRPGPPAEAQSFPRRGFYGRKHGRRLRSGLKQLLEDLLPRLRIALPDPGGRLDPAGLFCAPPAPTPPAPTPPAPTPPAEVWLEIGFGGGEHLAWQAERHPDVGLLGAEYFVNGVAVLLRLLRDRDLDNVRIMLGDGRALLDALPPDSLGRVFILFPDPWRKMRHHKRRIVQRETLDRLAELMKDGAELRLATDHPDYLRWILDKVCAHPDFQWLAESPGDWRERPPDWPPTRYELKALGQGGRPVFLRFRRRARVAE